LLAYEHIFSLEGRGEQHMFCKIKTTYLTKNQQPINTMKDALERPSCVNEMQQAANGDITKT